MRQPKRPIITFSVTYAELNGNRHFFTINRHWKLKQSSGSTMLWCEEFSSLEEGKKRSHEMYESLSHSPEYL